MKALTIKQPWAELIMQGLKDVENRSRMTSFRGRFAVHVGLRRADFDDLGLDTKPPRFYKPTKDAWERHSHPGYVIGTVELVDCVDDSASPWAVDGFWHWLLRHPQRYARPVRAKGQLGLWEWRR
jgi:ASCH domain